jgi:hypothetical protein
MKYRVRYTGDAEAAEGRFLALNHGPAANHNIESIVILPSGRAVGKTD